MSHIVVNCMGDQCPVPVVKTMKALAAMTEPGTLEIHVDYGLDVNYEFLADCKIAITATSLNQ